MKAATILTVSAVLVVGCQSMSKKTESPVARGALAKQEVSLLSLGQVVSNKDLDGIPVPKAAKPVNIDGKLDDPAWKTATALTDFITGRSQRSEVETRALITYDDVNLYVAVICAEPNTDKLVATASGRDGKVWDDDSVEVYLDPGATKKGDYYGFFLNSKNVIYDRTRNANWSGEWTSQAAVIPGAAWVAELAIPFKTLELKAEPGCKLGLMVARLRRAGLTQDQWMYLVPCENEAKNTRVYPVLQLK